MKKLMLILTLAFAILAAQTVFAQEQPAPAEKKAEMIKAEKHAKKSAKKAKKAAKKAKKHAKKAGKKEVKEAKKEAAQ